jgi:hypothetical protein
MPFLLGIFYTVILLSLLSLSVQMTVSPSRRLGAAAPAGGDAGLHCKVDALVASQAALAASHEALTEHVAASPCSEYTSIDYRTSECFLLGSIS